MKERNKMLFLDSVIDSYFKSVSEKCQTSKRALKGKIKM